MVGSTNTVFAWYCWFTWYCWLINNVDQTTSKYVLTENVTMAEKYSKSRKGDNNETGIKAMLAEPMSVHIRGENK